MFLTKVEIVDKDKADGNNENRRAIDRKYGGRRNNEEMIKIGRRR